jgi:hypothetical protein
MPELTRRYIVMPMATEGPFDRNDPDAPFVLKPWKDPAALQALQAYRDHCYPELGQELSEWIRAIRSGPVLRGGVGARNEPYLAASLPSAAAPPPARERRVPRGKVKSQRKTYKQGKKKAKRR